MFFLALVSRSLEQVRRITLAVLALLIAFQIALVLQAAAAYEAQSFEIMARLVPGFLKRGLGGLVPVIVSFQGIVSTAYFHPIIVILAAQFAIYLATEPAADVERGFVDLLLSRPISRRWIITRSLLVMLLCTSAAAAVMTGATWIGLHLFAPAGAVWPAASTLFMLAVHLAAVAWCFGAVGLAVGATARRRGTAFAIVGVTAVFLYLVDFVSLAWEPLRLFAFVSPFHYNPGLSILAGVAHPVKNLSILGSATIVAVGLAYWKFSSRDV